ncbi:MAG: RNA-binding protein [Candidatus Omnitrophica bacterium]|nr:RNA-binding protein [Candidatus Omnitrophota bacterium]MDD5771365.1 RNA-binding protein [Candidatus Omnitrophota bacterium]
MNIFVGNLSFSAGEDDLYRAFAAFGEIASAAIVMEKNGRRSRGFGFVDMPVREQALSAIAALDGVEILGRPVNVMVALSANTGGKAVEGGHFRQRQQGSVLKRTGKYKQGRRSISYMNKCIAAGITASVPERKFKVNPMRWRKKPKRFNLARRKKAED